MGKNIKDYLHLYLGCEIEIIQCKTSEVKILKGFTLNSDNSWTVWDSYDTGYCSSGWAIKPILRPLSDMKEEDVSAWGQVKIIHTSYCAELDSIDEFGEFTSIYPDGSILSKSKDDGDIRPINGGELFRLLLSKGFDLFGLIDSGLAVDAATIKNKI